MLFKVCISWSFTRTFSLLLFYIFWAFRYCILYEGLILLCCTTAFKNLRVRVGGSLQDQVVYGVGNSTSSCHSFRKQKGGLFGFSKGCLTMQRWDEVNNFFRKTG